MIRWTAFSLLLAVATRGFAADAITPVALQFYPTLQAPTGEYWSSLQRPSITNDGTVLFQAAVQAVLVDGGDGVVYREGSGQFLARGGAQAPQLAPGVNFESLGSLQANPAGPAAFMGSVNPNGSGRAVGLWAENNDMSVRLVALSGAQPPGVPDGLTISSFLEYSPRYVVNGRGETAFFASLQSPDAPLAGAGIWTEGGGRGLRLLARSGTPVPEFHPDAQLYHFGGLPQVRMNDNGTAVFQATLQSTGSDYWMSDAILLDDPDNGLVVAARSGDAAPGLGPLTTFRSLDSPSINSAGQILFSATHQIEGQESLQRGLWAGLPGDLKMVARAGDPAPGVDATFETLPSTQFGASPVINGRGQVAFTARIAGPGIDESNDTGIWAQDVDGTLRLIVREGDLGPSQFLGDDFFHYDRSIIFNNRGQIAFDVSGGVWATDLSGQVHSIVRRGDLLPFGNGLSQVYQLDIDSSTGNEDGLATSFNDRGELVFWAQSEGHRMGIFLSRAVAVPEPRAATLQLLAIAAAGFFSRRSARGMLSVRS